MITRKKSIAVRMRENPRVQKAMGVLLPLLLAVLILLLWQTQVLHAILHTDVFTLPLPTRIVAIILDNWSSMLVDIRATVFVAAAGLLLGSVIGYLVAVIAAMAPKWGGAGLPIVSAFNAIPIVALAPVMTNWTKSISSQAEVRSMVAKILVVMIVSIASMSINAYRGLTELKTLCHGSDDILRSDKTADIFQTSAAQQCALYFYCVKGEYTECSDQRHCQ